VALEPDTGEVTGSGALKAVAGGLPIEMVQGKGEGLPFPDRHFDIVYCRQVLHHAGDLGQFLKEAFRVLRPGGILLACREHVVDNPGQLQEFLASHPVHALTGNEHAYSVKDYQGAIRKAGLKILKTLGPWDSVINAFPAVRSREELRGYTRQRLQIKLGKAGFWLSLVPGVRWAFMRWRVDLPLPGRLYSFMAARPV
jgi:SAM-dependent methyltransferase